MEIKRRRRLRKKLFLDEFAVLGFEIACKSTITDASKMDSFIDEFIEFIESQNLSFGGGFGDNEFSGFVCSNDRYGSPVDSDRDALYNWLQSHSKIENTKVGQLVDANYEI